MSELWLPDSFLLSTEEYEVREGLHYADEFRRQLKSIDSRLDLIYVKAGAPSFPQGHRWYIIRNNDSGQPSLWMVDDEEGNYCEPNEKHLARLQEMDAAAHPNVWRKFEAARLARKARADKALEEKSREFRETLLDRLNHLYDERIAITAEHKEKLKVPPQPPRKIQARKRKRRG